jgi:hypothetical protein
MATVRASAGRQQLQKMVQDLLPQAMLLYRGMCLHLPQQGSQIQ